MAEAITTEQSNVSSTSTSEQIDVKTTGDSKTFSQEEVNKILSERLSKAETKSAEATRKAVEDAIADYDRRQKLTAEERASEESKKRESELAEKERSITLRENRADAIEQLANKKIDTRLVDFVVDLDPAKMDQNIKQLEKTFNEAVQTAVTAKMTGKSPTDYGTGSKTDLVHKKSAHSKRGIYRDGVTGFNIVVALPTKKEITWHERMP